MDYQDYSIGVLKGAGYRITDPRRLVLMALSEASGPMNAYDIERKTDGALDVSTAYRILEVFQQLKLVHFVKDLQGYIACKNFGCKNLSHCHHQFVCKSCDGVSEVYIDDHKMIEDLKQKMADFKIDDHYLEFSGTCSQCLSK